MTLETQAAFARRLNKDRAHVTRLKKAGRLVMRGKLVAVDETLQRLEATESPLARDQASRERFAAQRAAQAAEGGKNADAVQVDDSLEAIGLEMKRNQSRKIAAEAEIAQMERDKMAGTLVDAAELGAAILALGAKVRGALEGIPDRQAAELAAAVEPSQVHALLSEAVGVVLAEFARECKRLAERPGGA